MILCLLMIYIQGASTMYTNIEVKLPKGESLDDTVDNAPRFTAFATTDGVQKDEYWNCRRKHNIKIMV